MQIVSEIEIAVLTASSASSCKRNCKMNCSSCCCYRGKYYGNSNSSCTSNSDVVMEIGRGGVLSRSGEGGELSLNGHVRTRRSSAALKVLTTATSLADP